MALTNFEKQWINENAIILQNVYPNATREKIDSILRKILKEKMKVEPIEMVDTYKGITYTSDALQLMEFCEVRKPLTAGNGVLMDRDGRNPAVKMLNRMGDQRKFFKKRMKTYHPDSYEFARDDLYQGNEKVKMNAWYGINGAPTALFFNLECATAITGKGRHLISTATLAFDTFLGGHVVFLDMDDCLYYIKNILSEKGKRKIKDKDLLDRNISLLQVKNRLISMFENKYDYVPNILEPLLSNLSKEDLNRIYYKNNLFNFCLNSKVKEMIRDFVTCTEIYTNPDPYETPDFLKVKLENFWRYVKEYVFYNHSYVDKVYRVVNKQRKAVLVIDTDSNMLHMAPWIEFVKDNILTNDDIEQRDETNLNYVILYTMCYVLANMIRKTLDTYLKNCNVKKENRSLLDMKNEFLFSAMLIAEVKKNYAALKEYKEGKPMFGKPEIKGLPIKKSSTNRIASKRFEEILINDILKAEKISVIDILVKLNEFEKEIRQSLKDGEYTFLKPTNVKDPMAYDDPLKIAGFRGAMVWNELYPNKEIILPDSFFLVKLNVYKPDDLYRINDEEVRNKIDKLIFQNEEKRIKSKGLYILAVPRGEKIPDWAIDCIDNDTIVDDTMKAFLGVVKALGPCTISKDAKSSQFSNIVNI